MTVDFSQAVWRKSSRSSGSGNGDCVEVADNLADVVLVRDTKDREGEMLAIAPAAWRAFVGFAKQR
ncbi:DUF397 domain-containing protein [Micromonospora sp. NPDC050397]|uniref:DUF397 domain-containing protein n=1 Tax=Micromonospora sp. NPDC050397 TaxID=3364279 RepID=UPI003850E14D